MGFPPLELKGHLIRRNPAAADLVCHLHILMCPHIRRRSGRQTVKGLFSSRIAPEGIPAHRQEDFIEYIASATLQHSLPWTGESPRQAFVPCKCPVAMLLYRITFSYISRAKPSALPCKQGHQRQDLNAMACIHHMVQLGPVLSTSDGRSRNSGKAFHNPAPPPPEQRPASASSPPAFSHTAREGEPGTHTTWLPTS